MKPQEKLNKAARAHGWANWSEVLMHNAPAHVINLIVEEAMRGEKVENPEPALTWRPGAKVRITSVGLGRDIYLNQVLYVDKAIGAREWLCAPYPESDIVYAIHESDAVVVG